jgi:hypothetical protein
MAKRRPKNNNVKNSRISNYVPGESNDLASSINRLIQVLEDNSRKSNGGGNKEEKDSAAASRSKKMFNKLGLGKVTDLAETFLPKSVVKKFHNSVGEKMFGKGALNKGAKGLSSLGGNLLRIAGPAAALGGLAKMAYDFWNSGGAAKALSTMKMMSGNKMLGAGGIAEMSKSLEGTEAFRKIDAEFLYKKPLELKQQLQQDVFNYEKQGAMEMLQYNQSLVKDQIEYEIGLKKDALVFGQQQAMQTLDAENEKRSALQQMGLRFITKYQKISERALKAVGSSSQEIATAMGKFQTAFGYGAKSMTKITEQAAALSKYFGGSTDDVLNMTKLFKIGAKISGEMASNLIGGLGVFAEKNGLIASTLFGEISNAAEEIAKFADMNYNNLVREAGILSKMSVSYKEMLGATDSMVLNYKDSIKSEMSLSAMLGRNVNLSEVRARLMANDSVGAANALKSSLGGMDINAMNAFQRQALAQATGMSTTALMALLQGSGGSMSGELSANAEAGKQIADQMLKTEVANAGRKLGLEQAQRLELLKFEQKQRLVMLMAEQQQRLAGIQLEAAYRAKWSLYYEKQNIKDMAAADALVESAASIFAAGNLKQQMSGAFAASGVTMKGADQQNIIGDYQKLVKAGYIKDDQLAEVMKKMMDAKDPTSVLDQYGLKDYKEKVDKEIGAQKIKLASFQKLITMYSKSSSEEYLAYEAKVKKSFPKTFEQFQASGGARYMNENTAFMKNLKDMVGSVSISAPAGTAKETANLTTAVSTLNTTMNATIPTNLEKTTVAVAAGTKQAKDDSFNLKNVLQQIFQAEANGYTKLLRQGEVTNELLSNVIDATLQGKNITMDSTRVTKALQKVKNNQYGLGSTVQTTTGVTGYASSIIAG